MNRKQAEREAALGWAGMKTRTISGWWIWFPRLGRVRFAPVGVRLVCVELTRPEAAEFLRALRRVDPLPNLEAKAK